MTDVIENISLEMECSVEELAPAQLAAYEKLANEHMKIRNSLRSLMSTNEGKELFNGEVFSAYSFKGHISEDFTEATLPEKRIPPIASPPAQVVESKPLERNERRKRSHNFLYVESSDDDIPLAKRIIKPSSNPPARRGRPPKALQQLNARKNRSVSLTSPIHDIKSPVQESHLSPVVGKSTISPKLSSSSNVEDSANGTPDDATQAENFRPSEVTSVGGLIIDIDAKDIKCSEKDAKLQGKTFPSLVVLAKPFLKMKDMSATRIKLDSKVKVVLMLTPNKFTEWLIQEGLLKSEQRCTNHSNNELKLGVYSDATKFPYSGGYVWISECCPTRFVSVFHGSLFEGAPHPPTCILKLIYHWSCQTNIQNVVQWVKVDNIYIKGVYTWLRAACTIAIHQKCKLLGGPDKFVELGVISLGTTSQDGQQRQVKVEVLGVLDYAEKTIRLRAVEPLSDADRNFKKRFQTILEPLSKWVDKDSTIVIDLTVDKMTLFQMGYKNIIQASVNDTTAKHTNITVMDYLRRIVPRMFQNTLSLLSRQMIQQFLDELVWREEFGTYALQAFNNITAHIAEQTRMNTNETLTQRLYQVATNPFKDWSVVPTPPEDSPVPSTTPKRLKKPINEQDYVTPTETKVQIEKKPTLPKRKVDKALNVEKRISTPTTPKIPPITKKIVPLIKKTESIMKSEEPEPAKNDNTRGLEELYYGTKKGADRNYEPFPPKVVLNCPLCGDTFTSNETFQTHLVTHISIGGKTGQFQCLFCLEAYPSETVLAKHTITMHPKETKTETTASYYCLICHQRHNNINLLTVHLHKSHTLLEMPYICEACGYRSSSHRDLIRHFYDDHKKANFLQCPFCLAVYRISVKNEIRPKVIEAFYMHLKAHQAKLDTNKCQKCVLSFLDKGFLKMHLTYHHQGNSKNQQHIHPLVGNSAVIEIPKARIIIKETLPYTVLSKYNELCIYLKSGSICTECDTEILNEDHYLAQLKCTNCSYKTRCEGAMFRHFAKCQILNATNSSESMELSTVEEMHCICGFSAASGNKMAHHLAICGQKSAYSSYDNALENTVKRSMLDMLGLVRRDSEQVTLTEPNGESGPALEDQLN